MWQIEWMAMIWPQWPCNMIFIEIHKYPERGPENPIEFVAIKSITKIEYYIRIQFFFRRNVKMVNNFDCAMPTKRLLSNKSDLCLPKIGHVWMNTTTLNKSMLDVEQFHEWFEETVLMRDKSQSNWCLLILAYIITHHRRLSIKSHKKRLTYLYYGKSPNKKHWSRK